MYLPIHARIASARQVIQDATKNTFNLQKNNKNCNEKKSENSRTVADSEVEMNLQKA